MQGIPIVSLYNKFPANIIMEIRVWIFQNYRDCRYTCNPHDDYMHVTGNTLRHRDSLHFLWGKHLQCTRVKVGNPKSVFKGDEKWDGQCEL